LKIILNVNKRRGDTDLIATRVTHFYKRVNRNKNILCYVPGRWTESAWSIRRRRDRCDSASGPVCSADGFLFSPRQTSSTAYYATVNRLKSIGQTRSDIRPPAEEKTKSGETRTLRLWPKHNCARRYCLLFTVRALVCLFQPARARWQIVARVTGAIRIPSDKNINNKFIRHTARAGRATSYPVIAISMTSL